MASDSLSALEEMLAACQSMEHALARIKRELVIPGDERETWLRANDIMSLSDETPAPEAPFSGAKDCSDHDPASS